MMNAENLNEIVNTIIIPVLQVGFPIALIFAVVEKIINVILSFIRGDKTVKL